MQQDNDLNHTAVSTKDFIRDKKKSRRFSIWPHQSPDLNPVEHAFHKNTQTKNIIFARDGLTHV